MVIRKWTLIKVVITRLIIMIALNVVITFSLLVATTKYKVVKFVTTSGDARTAAGNSRMVGLFIRFQLPR